MLVEHLNVLFNAAGAGFGLGLEEVLDFLVDRNALRPSGWRIGAALNVAGKQLGAGEQAADAAHVIVAVAADFVAEAVEHERRSLDRGGRGETDPEARKALVEANLKRAEELVHDGELYLAIQLLEQACVLDPRPAELLKLSRLLLRNPLWTNRALTCMRRAIEADPQHVEAWIELAEFWRRRRHAERQRKALERALAVDPDSEHANEMYRDLVGKKELERLLRRARQMH